MFIRNKIIPIFLILIMGTWGLFFVPQQTSASCGSSGNLTNEITSIIQGIHETQDAANSVISEIQNTIQNTGQVAEEHMGHVVNTIQQAENLPEAIKNELIDKINNKLGLSDEDIKLISDTLELGKGEVEAFIENVLESIEGMGGTGWILGQLLRHTTLERICQGWEEIFANLTIAGTSIGTKAAWVIAQFCPIIVERIWRAYILSKRYADPPDNIQKIQFPVFEPSYQWELGIPGFFKPGEITEF
jgi:hypothetical protein